MQTHQNMLMIVEDHQNFGNATCCHIFLKKFDMILKIGQETLIRERGHIAGQLIKSVILSISTIAKGLTKRPHPIHKFSVSF